MRPKKEIKLEKKINDKCTHGLLYRFFATWKTHKRYESVAQAQQAHEGLTKSYFYRQFEWRIESPVGLIMLK